MTTPGDGRASERASGTHSEDTSAAAAAHARAVWPPALQRAAAAGLITYGSVRTLTCLGARLGPSGRGKVRVADLIVGAGRTRRSVQQDLRAAVEAGLLARSGGGNGRGDLVIWSACLPESGPAAAPVIFRQVVRIELLEPVPAPRRAYVPPRLPSPSRRWAGRR